ncbi:MAG: hypothetical protein JEY94_16730 [Melioribacteraceae bacterium]|nr:hypothetical protein [Melioribacteraceae bacterium]
MFEREIKFINDFNVNKVKNLGSFFTYSQIADLGLHPAILKYISAEIDFLIYEDRQNLLRNSMFDYSGVKISNHLNIIAEEIKKTKRFSLEYISKLILHAASFNVHYIVQPRNTLIKFLFDDKTHKNTVELNQILNYVYFYDYIKKILSAYINKKKILSLNIEEFSELLIKIDKIGLESDKDGIIESAFTALNDFMTIGSSKRNDISINAFIIFLQDRMLYKEVDLLKQLKSKGANRIDLVTINSLLSADDIKSLEFEQVESDEQSVSNAENEMTDEAGSDQEPIFDDREDEIIIEDKIDEDSDKEESKIKEENIIESINEEIDEAEDDLNIDLEIEEKIEEEIPESDSDKDNGEEALNEYRKMLDEDLFSNENSIDQKPFNETVFTDAGTFEEDIPKQSESEELLSEESKLLEEETGIKEEIELKIDEEIEMIIGKSENINIEIETDIKNEENLNENVIDFQLESSDEEVVNLEDLLDEDEFELVEEEIIEDFFPEENEIADADKTDSEEIEINKTEEDITPVSEKLEESLNDDVENEETDLDLKSEIDENESTDEILDVYLTNNDEIADDEEKIIEDKNEIELEQEDVFKEKSDSEIENDILTNEDEPVIEAESDVLEDDEKVEEENDLVDDTNIFKLEEDSDIIIEDVTEVEEENPELNSAILIDEEEELELFDIDDLRESKENKAEEKEKFESDLLVNEKDNEENEPEADFTAEDEIEIEDEEISFEDVNDEESYSSEIIIEDDVESEGNLESEKEDLDSLELDDSAKNVDDKLSDSISDILMSDEIDETGKLPDIPIEDKVDLEFEPKQPEIKLEDDENLFAFDDETDDEINEIDEEDIKKSVIETELTGELENEIAGESEKESEPDTLKTNGNGNGNLYYKKPTLDMDELLENRKMSRIIEVVFDYDMEEFSDFIDRIEACNDEDEVEEIFNRLAKNAGLKSHSKEVNTLRDIILDYFE